jgi:hypothetical protein
MTIQTEGIPDWLMVVGMIAFFIFLFGVIFPYQNSEWHKHNDICNYTCITVLDSNQRLIDYEKDSFDMDRTFVCGCSIHDCKTPNCSVYEIKTLYTNITDK